MDQQEPKWLPSVTMPPVIYGVIMPQPIGTVSTLPTHQSSLTYQIPVVQNKLNEPSWNYQQCVMAQKRYFSSPPQNQQLLLTEKKVANEKRSPQGKTSKQRHFDEQKEKLKDFSCTRFKGSSSADAMIENILSLENNSSKLNTLTKNVFSNDKLTPPSASPNLVQLGNETQSFSEHPKQSSQKQHPANYLWTLNSSMGSAISPLNLPDWLSDPCQIPELYKRAWGLVEKGDGWVDTSRAYMLLMRTNVPPHYLGILWEMVNRSKPGVLNTKEFSALLALVALIQNGVPFTSVDALTSLESPICPFIDHPVLLPFVEEQFKRLDCPPGNSQLPLDDADDDEFNDFVSAGPVSDPSREANATNAVDIPFPSDSNNSISLRSKARTNEGNSINLPTLGTSPHNEPPTKAISESFEEEFSDFQEASMPNESVPDKYAAFREIDPKNDAPIEASFGQLCSGGLEPSDVAVSHIVSEGSGELQNESSDDNLFDSRKRSPDFVSISVWAKDPFGEFDSNFSPVVGSSSGDQHITSKPCDSDDEFGDFVDSTSTSTLKMTDPYVETTLLDSVAVVLNLSCQSSKVLLEQNVNVLSLHPEFDDASSETLTEHQSQLNVVLCQDKYSIMTEQSKLNLSEVCVASWKKCLDGCFKLLMEALKILESISLSSVFEEIMETSQMKGYLSNLTEVKKVSDRIRISSATAAVMTDIQELILKCENTWTAITDIVGARMDFKEYSNELSDSEAVDNVCSVCLLRGGASMEFGGYTYHPPCANLWLNVVHLTLPSLVAGKGNLLRKFSY